jgi:hypothetical protein
MMSLQPERKRVVDNFINARLRGSLHIRSFLRLGTYLENERDRKNPGKFFQYGISESDAETLFMRLIALTRGSEPQATDCTHDQAIDRLYTYINVLREDTETREDIVGVPYSDQKFASMLSKVDAILNKMDKRDEEFLAMLTDVKAWMNKYGKILERIDNDSRSLTQRVQKLDRKP